jgi:hypothetical protein
MFRIQYNPVFLDKGLAMRHQVSMQLVLGRHIDHGSIPGFTKRVYARWRVFHGDFFMVNSGMRTD